MKYVRGYRKRDQSDFIIKEFDALVSMGVKNIRISDEMFLLNKKY